MPISFISRSADQAQDIYLSRLDTHQPGGMASFIKINKKTGMYYFDRPEFERASNDAPIYEENAQTMLHNGGSVRPMLKCSRNQSRNGNLEICEMTYTNGENVWVQRYFSFYKPGVLAASHKTPPLSKSKASDLKFMGEAIRLFTSFSVADER